MIPNTLTVKDNWGYLSFYYGNGDTKIKELYGVFINGEYYRTVEHIIYDRVSDHGHSYNVTTNTFNIIAEIGQIPVEIDIRQFIGRARISIKNEDVIYCDEE